MTTKTDRALEFIKNAGRTVTLAEIADHLGYENAAQASTLISQCRKGARGSADWQNVSRPNRGRYVYNKNSVAKWMAVGEVNGRIVLKGPDGALFAATPLQEILK